MSQIIKEISVDVARKNTFQAIVAKQYDNKSRYLKITLTNEGEPITVEPASSVIINAERKDGEVSSFLGVVNSDGTVTVPITYWMLEIDDTVLCNISVLNASEERLSSTSFEIEVEYAPDNASITPAEHEDIILQIFAKVSEIENMFESQVLKYTTLTTGTQTSAFVDNTDLGVMYHIEFSAISYDFMNLDENTQIRFSSLGEVEIRTKSGESWSAQDEWFMVANKDTYASLVNFLAVWNSTDYVSVVNLGTVSSTTAFNEAKYCAEMVKFNFIPQGSLAAQLQTSYPCTLTYNSEYQVIEPIKRAVKIVRKVNSVAPTFSADNWEVIQ